MPVSSSLKDRLRVFEGQQKETISVESPQPKIATPHKSPAVAIHSQRLQYAVSPDQRQPSPVVTATTTTHNNNNNSAITMRVEAPQRSSNATPTKPRSVVDQYLQNTRGSSDSKRATPKATVTVPSPKLRSTPPASHDYSRVDEYLQRGVSKKTHKETSPWKKQNQNQNLRHSTTPPIHRGMVESREVSDIHRQDEPCDRADPERDAYEERDVSADSPRKPLSAYEALVREKNGKKLSTPKSTFIPTPSPSKLRQPSPGRAKTVMSPHRKVVTSPMAAIGRAVPPKSKSNFNFSPVTQSGEKKTTPAYQRGNKETPPASQAASDSVGAFISPVVATTPTKTVHEGIGETKSTLEVETDTKQHLSNKQQSMEQKSAFTVLVPKSPGATPKKFPKMTYSNKLPSSLTKKTPPPARSSPLTHQDVPPEIRNASTVKTVVQSNFVTRKFVPPENLKTLEVEGVTTRKVESPAKEKSKLPSPRFSLSPAAKKTSQSPLANNKLETLETNSSKESLSSSKRGRKTTPSPARKLQRQALSLMQKESLEEGQSLSTLSTSRSFRSPSPDAANATAVEKADGTSSLAMLPLFPAKSKRPRETESSQEEQTKKVTGMPSGGATPIVQDTPTSNKKTSRLRDLRERSPTLFKGMTTAPSASNSKAGNNGKDDPLSQMQAYNKVRTELSESSNAGKRNTAKDKVRLDSTPGVSHDPLNLNAKNPLKSTESNKKSQQGHARDRRSRTKRYANVVKQKARFRSTSKSPQAAKTRLQSNDSDAKKAGSSPPKTLQSKRFFGSPNMKLELPYSSVESSLREHESPAQHRTKELSDSADEFQKKQDAVVQKSNVASYMFTSPFIQQIPQFNPKPSGNDTTPTPLNELFNNAGNHSQDDSSKGLESTGTGRPQQVLVTNDSKLNHMPSMGSLTAEGEEEMIIFSPLQADSPGRNIDTGDFKPATAPRSPSTPSYKDARSVFEKPSQKLDSAKNVSANVVKLETSGQKVEQMKMFWGQVSEEEKVLSSMERLYNTQARTPTDAQVKIQNALNPFSPSTDGGSGSFPTSFDETLMETADLPVEDPSFQSSTGERETNASSTSTGHPLHGEYLAEDGSLLHYSSGSQNLKTSRSSATGNFVSSSSSLMSKSTISKEEFLKALTRSTVSSSDVERLAPIPDVPKEEEPDTLQKSGEAKNESEEEESSAIENTKDSKVQGEVDHNPKKDALRWWQRKYAKNVTGETDKVVNDAFSRERRTKRANGRKEYDDVFSGLEEEHFEKSTDDESAIPPPPPPPPPLNAKIGKVGSRRSKRRSQHNNVDTIYETSGSEMSSKIEPAEGLQQSQPESHSGMVVDGYRMDKVASDITQPTTEGRERRKVFTKNDRFGPIEEINQTPHMDPNNEIAMGSSAETDSRSSRLENEISNTRFKYPADSDKTDSNSQNASDFDSLKNGRKGQKLSRSEETDLGEGIDVDESASISFNTSIEDNGRSAFEFSTSTFLGLGYSIYQSISNALQKPEDLGKSCAQNGFDCGYAMNFDEATEFSSRHVVPDSSLSPVTELNEEERKRWENWEERDESSGKKPNRTKKGKDKLREQENDLQDTSSTSSTDSSTHRQRTVDRREKAQATLLEHARKAQNLGREDQEVEESMRILKAVSSGAQSADEKSERSATSRSVYVQQHILEKFSSLLRSDKVEVLKLNRHGKWQIRYITVSREVSWLKNKGVSATPKSSQFPQALLWYKTQNSKANGLVDLKNDGRGGFLFSQLVKVERDPNVAPPAPFPRKLKVRYSKYAGVRIQYACEDGEREIIFSFQDPTDAKAFCTAVGILGQVVNRNENDL